MANTATAVKETDEAPETQETETAPAKKAPRAKVFTPFQAHKELNEALTAAGLEANIQGPMVYSYAKQNRFDTQPAKADVEAGADKPRLEVIREGEHGWDAFMAQFVIDRKSGKKSKAGKTEDSEGDQEETDAILSDPETMEAIAEGESDLTEGEDDEVEAE